MKKLALILKALKWKEESKIFKLFFVKMQTFNIIMYIFKN